MIFWLKAKIKSKFYLQPLRDSAECSVERVDDSRPLPEEERKPAGSVRADKRPEENAANETRECKNSNGNDYPIKRKPASQGALQPLYRRVGQVFRSGSSIARLVADVEIIRIGVCIYCWTFRHAGQKCTFLSRIIAGWRSCCYIAHQRLHRDFRRSLLWLQSSSSSCASQICGSVIRIIDPRYFLQDKIVRLGTDTDREKWAFKRLTIFL